MCVFDHQAVVPSPVNVEGCVSVAQEGNSYSQNAVLKWGDRSVRQGMKYQVLIQSVSVFSPKSAVTLHLMLRLFLLDLISNSSMWISSHEPFLTVRHASRTFQTNEYSDNVQVRDLHVSIQHVPVSTEAPWRNTHTGAGGRS